MNQSTKIINQLLKNMVSQAGECDKCEEFRALNWTLCAKCGKSVESIEKIAQKIEDFMNEECLDGISYLFAHGYNKVVKSSIGEQHVSDKITATMFHYLNKFTDENNIVCEFDEKHNGIRNMNLFIDMENESRNFRFNKEKLKKVKSMLELSKEPLILMVIYKFDKEALEKQYHTKDIGSIKIAAIHEFGSLYHTFNDKANNNLLRRKIKYKIFTKSQFEAIVPFFKNKNYLRENMLILRNENYNRRIIGNEYYALYDNCENIGKTDNLFEGVKILRYYKPLLKIEMLREQLGA